MNEVRITANFVTKAKRLFKKYRTLKSNLDKLSKALIIKPTLGESYGANIYKIRVADESKGKGKSGGFRVVTYLVNKTPDSTNIYLITIFDKSEESSIEKDDIKQIIKSEVLL